MSYTPEMAILMAKVSADSYKFFKGEVVEAVMFGSALYVALPANGERKSYKLSHLLKVHILKQEFLIETRNSFYIFSPTDKADAAYLEKDLKDLAIKLVYHH